MSRRYTVRIGSAVMLLAGAGSLAAGFTVDWWTVDGGGALRTTGGDFELSGTVGQPDAGPVMSGGVYTLSGGFWVLPAGPQYPVGDLNCDGVVDFDDIDPFVLALSGPAGYEAAWPNCRWLNADCNGDGDVDFDDIDAFVAILSGG